MIVKSATAILNHQNYASIFEGGHALISIGSEDHHMTAEELKDMWAKLGVLIREFNKWNG